MSAAAGPDAPPTATCLASRRHWLFGCDRSPGIVSVTAAGDGRARVWRRLSRDRVEVAEHRFPSWFLTTSLELVAHLALPTMAASELRMAHGQLDSLDGSHVVRLDGGDAAAYRYLVLTDSPREVEAAVVETYNKRVNGSAHSLQELRGLVIALPAVEQFLLLTGRSYFTGLDYADTVRLQFDLETTGLDDQRDRIFMVSMRDSRGWRTCLDTGTMTEAQLIEQFVALVRQRDPDVIENHNIFAFDLPFLVRRAAQLGVRLALGRDGSVPSVRGDVFHTGDHSEAFARCTIVGREVIDTQQAVRRYGRSAPDMRRHGLKDAARYFGFARVGREYVPGAEIWATFRQDPERVRRYACDDVDEADGLSRRLLPPSFVLACMVPRPYERIAADLSPPSLIEPLLLRAYLHEGRAVPAPLATGHASAADRSGRPNLLARGVVANPAAVCLARLAAAVLVADGSRPSHDELGAFPALLADLMALAGEHRAAGAAASEDVRVRHRAWASATETLAEAGQPYLAHGGHLFADGDVAARAGRRARGVVDDVLAELRRRRCLIVEVDGPRVVFGAPPAWGAADEQAVAHRVQPSLPVGVELQFTGGYQAVYARAPGSHVWLGRDGSVTIVGKAFRAGKRERFGEQFLRQAAPLALLGAATDLRRLFLETVARLRNGDVPAADLCVQEILHKSPSDYQRAGYHEEPYEVLLASGARTWRTGQRVRYFHDRTGGVRLLQEGHAAVAEPDREYYAQRLRSVYCQHFAAAFRPDDFARIFRLPKGLADESHDESLEDVKPVVEPVLATLELATDADMAGTI